MGATPIAIGSDRLIGRDHPTLVVAEIGQNHNGSAEMAEQLIDAAAWAGADAVKMVKRDLDAELSRDARRQRYENRHAFGVTYGEHRRALELSAEDHASLRDRARSHGLLFVGTPCDTASARMFASLKVDALKVASRDLENTPLLEHLTAYRLPIFLSTGMSSFAEIDSAVDVFKPAGADYLLLQCTSLYPAPTEEVHLRGITALEARYSVPVGFSDHSLGTLFAPVAVGMGAAVIEKHITLNHRLRGTDHACSLEPEEFRTLTDHVRLVDAAKGRDDKSVARGVGRVRDKLGRSLVVTVPLRPGTQIEESMLTLKCPGDGMAWSDRHRVLGRHAVRHLAADEKLSSDDVC